jgi:hypothetical protein
MMAELKALITRIESQGVPLPEDERDWLESIKTLDDLVDYTPDHTGRWQALAWDAAKALGLSNWDAGSVAGDH